MKNYPKKKFSDFKIKETLIQIDTTLLIPDKDGVDIYFASGYSIDKKRHKKYYVDLTEKQILIIKELFAVDDADIKVGYLVRPTQSLLQKVLRSLHKIQVEVNWGTNEKNEIVWSYYINKVGNKTSNTKSNTSYNTYEEALEIGMLDALNKIPACK